MDVRGHLLKWCFIDDIIMHHGETTSGLSIVRTSSHTVCASLRLIMLYPGTFRLVVL